MEEEKEVLNIIKEFAEKLPKFPDGRIDYSKSNTAPVLVIIVGYKGKILLLKRSDKVLVYRGKWNGVAGYIDELKPIREKLLEEVQEELGIIEDNISLINSGESYQFIDKAVNKTWVIFPFLVGLKDDPVIKLDWEHSEYKWIKPEELGKFDTVPNLEVSLKKVLKN